MTDNKEQQEFWFNSKTNQVEVGKQSIAVYRIGPFASHEEAERAMEILASKSRQWREMDEQED
jgi:hypothetical protein